VSLETGTIHLIGSLVCARTSCRICLASFAEIGALTQGPATTERIKTTLMILRRNARTRSNEKEISHGRVSRQTNWTYSVKGPLASSFG
jgi:hypothetical protein